MKDAKEYGIRFAEYARRQIVPRKSSVAMPRPAELATLAAMLARTANEHPDYLCSRALNLWVASHETITLQQQCNEDHQELEAANAARPEPPEDQEWPMTLKTFCQILWPGKKADERPPIIRAWLHSLPGLMPEGMDYGMMNSETIAKPRFRFLRNEILRWYQRWKPETNSGVNSENAKRGWGYCDAKMQETPEYQEFNAECDERQRKPYKRYFVTWLKDKKKTPFEKLAALVKKKITSPS